MTSAHRPENLTWEISAMGHGWREGRAVERSVLRGWLDGVESGRAFQVRGRSRALGERELTIDGLELGGTWSSTGGRRWRSSCSSVAARIDR